MFFLGICGNAQNLIHISGLVTDELNNPLPYVNVSLKHSRIGTVTNAQGRFTLSIPLKTDSIVVSFMGYANSRQLLTSTKKEYHFQLIPSTIRLNEFLVSNLTAASLLKKAIHTIPQNYHQQPVLLKAFYRAKVMSKDTAGYAEEASFDIIKSYNSHFEDKYFLQMNRNFYIDKKLSNNILYGIETLDQVKQISTLFTSSFFRNHNIEFRPASSYDNRPVYVLQTTPKYGKSGKTGKIYIDVNDLAFVRIDLTDCKNNNQIIVQYKKTKDKYCFVSGSEKNTPIQSVLGNSKEYSAEVQWVVTELQTNFLKDSISGNYCTTESSLIGFPNNETDSVFWKNYNHVLPDENLQKVIDKHRLTAPEISTKSLQRKDQNLTPLLTGLSLWISTDSPNNLSILSKNMMSVDGGIEYLLTKTLKNPLIKTLGAYLYNRIISSSFLAVEAERELLANQGISVKYNPTIFNSYRSGYSYGLDNSSMENLKLSNYHTYMRLHTVKNDINYTSAKHIEERLARVDMSNINAKISYTYQHALELIFFRATNIFFGEGKDAKAQNLADSMQPLIIDPGKSWVKYLFEPNAFYIRNTKSGDLNNDEKFYLKRSSLFSFINLISPQMFGIKKFRISEKTRFTFSFNYLRTIFGEMFEQNFWISHNNNLSGLFLRQYINHEKTGLGIEYKLYDTKLAKNILLTSNINYWHQPTQLSFYDHSLSSGFSATQQIEWKFAEDKYIHRRNMSLFMGYNYKSNGYEPDNLHLTNNLDIQLGVKINLR